MNAQPKQEVTLAERFYRNDVALIAWCQERYKQSADGWYVQLCAAAKKRVRNYERGMKVAA